MGIGLICLQIVQYNYKATRLSTELYILIISFFFLITGLFLGKRLLLKRKGNAVLEIKNTDLLTDREKQIATELVNGSSNKDIAQKLYISENTVKTHLQKIFSKLQVSSRTQAMKKLMDVQSK